MACEQVVPHVYANPKLSQTLIHAKSWTGDCSQRSVGLLFLWLSRRSKGKPSAAKGRMNTLDGEPNR
ncbi:hypothetical protein ACKKBF_B40445 [Auxenochlorella protothecoides x Auxenochlorella symbiontica]